MGKGIVFSKVCRPEKLSRRKKLQLLLFGRGQEAYGFVVFNYCEEQATRNHRKCFGLPIVLFPGLYGRLSVNSTG